MTEPPFDCFTPRFYDDESDADDIMFPKADSASKSVLISSDDGDDVRRSTATRFELIHQGRTKRHPQAKLDDITLEIVVTDARVAFAVPKYDKGGGWDGGVVGLALNAASKARAASRSYGTCLVGHVRYPWLLAVGHSARFRRGGKRTTDIVRTGYVTRVRNSQVRVYVELDLSSDTDGHAIADEIVRRAARHRLQHHPTLSDEQQAGLEQRIETGIPREVTQGRWTEVSLPGTMVVSRDTAFY